MMAMDLSGLWLTINAERMRREMAWTRHRALFLCWSVPTSPGGASPSSRLSGGHEEGILEAESIFFWRETLFCVAPTISTPAELTSIQPRELWAALSGVKASAEPRE